MTFSASFIVDASEQSGNITTYHFQLPSQSLGASLNALSDVTRVSFLFPYELVENKRGNSIQGQYTLQQALDLLLEGSELVGEYSKDKVFLIKPLVIKKDNKRLEEIDVKTKKTILASLFAALFSSNSAIAQELDEEKITGEKELEVIQIRGIRSSLAKAAFEKQNAVGVQDSIAAEDIGKFPDQNVAESLQRITGVSISRTNGEGDGVSIRGFGPRFNVVRLNGRTLAVADGDRAFDFQVLPSELISGADVHKSSQASLPDGSLGGYVNLTSARPLDSEGMKATVSVGGRYEAQSEATTPRISGIFSNTFADDTMGFLFSFGYEASETRIDQWRGTRYGESDQVSNLQGNARFQDGTDVPQGFSILHPRRIAFESTQEARKRTSLAATFQYAPADEFAATFDILSVDLERESLTDGFQLPTQSGLYSDVVVTEHGTIASATVLNVNIDGLFRDVSEDQSTFAFGSNFKWQVNDNFSVVADASYSEAEASPRELELVPNFVRGTPSPENRDQGKFNIINHAALGGGDIVGFDSTIDLNDVSSIGTHWNGGARNEFEDEVLELKIDTEYVFDGGPIYSIQTGIEYTSRSKDILSYNNFSGPDGCSPCGGEVDLTDSLFSQGGVRNFLPDESGNSPSTLVGLINRQAYMDAILAIRAGLGIEGSPFDVPLDAQASYSVDEDILSIYAQVNFSGETDSFEWTVNSGFRYSETNVDSTGFGQRPLEIVVTSEPGASEIRSDVILSDPQVITGENDYSNFLPSVMVKFDFQNGFILRGGSGKTITRPALEYLGVNRVFDIQEGGVINITGNNINLSPYEVTSYDVSFEYYADDDSVYSLAFFHKEIDNFISTLTTTSRFNDSTMVVDPRLEEELGREPIQVTNTNENRQGGTVSGLELAGLYYLTETMGIQANYTYVNSQDDEALPIDFPNVSTPDALEGLAEHSYNLTAFYDNGRLQARLAYNWRDDFLFARTGGGITTGIPAHTGSYGQLDFSASYDVTENLSISLEGINLTNERLLQYADIRERVTNIQYTGSRYFIGARYTF